MQAALQNLRPVTKRIQELGIRGFAERLLPLEYGDWVPWPVQIRVWDALKPDARVNLLKTRQTGGTRSALAAILWYLIAEGGDYAIVLHVQPALETVEKMARAWLCDDAPLAVYGAEVTQRGISLKRDARRGILGGSVRFSCSGSGGVRGGTYKGVVLSELAYYDDAGEYLEGVKPALDRLHGWCLIETTPKGPGGAHEAVCTSPDWVQVRGFWHECPDCSAPAPETWEQPAELAAYARNTAFWYDSKLKSAIDVQKFLRENPASDAEAFAASGGLYLPPDQLRNPVRIGPDALPTPGRTYQIGLDVALGRGGDYTAYTVLDSLTGAQMMSWASNSVSIEAAATRVVFVARAYNQARICIDATGLGQAMVQAIRIICGYHNVVEFTFNRSSKGLLWGHVRSVLPMLGALDADTLNELRSLETNLHGLPVAVAGATDDRAMALALAVRAGGEHWVPQPCEATAKPATNGVDYRRTSAMSRLGLPTLRRGTL